ncbi:MAG: 50S ribosomal protein L18 [Chloroflexi bacterium]|nr:50S ribosomal protein L18 [Chloroflexota bacterium]MBM3174475.1 50S ribosomal protein L18 [Chloroflexota bacterium]MBM4449575.1 50S ribosomal protein L18 [Chloroflexota bacterium]
MGNKVELKRLARSRRHARLRTRVCGTGVRPRLSVFRSLNHIYAQIIDDTAGRTLVSASTLDKEISEKINGKKKTESAELVGGLVAKRALDKGIKTIVFDRGGYKYHGRVKALAESARKAGLEF